VKYSSNTGLRVGIALGAVIIIVAAIVVSKRRAASMGDEQAASTEISGATSPAASVGSAESTVSGQAVAADATVNAVPPVREPEEVAQNGHKSSGASRPADSAPGQQGE